MKKLQLFFIASLLLFTSSIFAQTDLNQELPKDPDVIYGVLDNGVTYYIRHNETPKNRAELTVAVKAGSVFEDEDQRGLAHFSEHMAFNGSKNFPKHELIDYLESIGMKFGPEVNAYTSFDETVYGIKVPLDTVEYLDKGLQVLYDWAFEVTFDGEEIDKERGVIHEEWRMNQGAQFRMMKKTIPALFKDSKYAERLPIGLMSVVDSCEHDVLRRFYNDWYRTDLVAVIAVGDFDVKVVEQKIKDLFNKKEKQENPREYKLVEIPNHKEPVIVITSDKEAQASSAQVFFKHDMFMQKTVKDYRTSIMHNLYNSMINKRLNELTLSETPPFIYGYSVYTHFLGPKDMYMAIAATKDDGLLTGMKAVLVENYRIKQHGFTVTELEREKKSLLKQVEKQYKNKDKQKSADYVNEYKSNFLLTETPFPGMEQEYAYYKEFMDGIKVEEVNAFANKWITDENMVVLLTAPEKEGVVMPTVEETKAALAEVKAGKYEPYIDKVATRPLFEDAKLLKDIELGKIEKKSKNKVFGSEEWILSNGVKVVFKTTDFKDNEIKMAAYSYGGYSVYPQSDDISSKIAIDVITESGLNGFDKIELEKLLSDKAVSLSPYIHELSEGFSGTATPEDFETMLQLTHLYFVKPRYDKTAYASYLTRSKANYENRSLNPQTAFGDTIRATLSQNSTRNRPWTSQILDEADYKRVHKIYRERYSDPSSFTFFFVGNFDAATAKPLIEKYLGSLSKDTREENWKDLGVRYPKGKIDKTVYKGEDPKSVVFMQFNQEFDYEMKSRIELDAISKVLSTKLLETIREDESGVYSIGAYPGSSKLPYTTSNVTIYFGCAPENVDRLSEGTFGEINKLKENGPTEADLNKVKAKLSKERESSLRENKYWLSTMKNYYFYNLELKDFPKYEKIVEDLSIESLKKAANKYFDDSNYVRVVLRPESEKK